MPETLADIQKRVQDRLSELEPLVEEYRQLQEVADSLGIEHGPDRQRGSRQTASSSTAPRRARRTDGPDSSASGSRATTKQGKPRRRAPRGQNREAIVTLVGQRPGITNRQIADETGISRRVVATAVSKYKRDGLLVAEGEGVKLGEQAGVV